MDTQTHDYAPGQILGFVRYMPVGTAQPEILAVVKTCGFVHKKGSIFSTIWKQEYGDTQNLLPSHFLVNVDCIVRRCLMIPIDNSSSSYHEIWSRERWANEFYEC